MAIVRCHTHNLPYNDENPRGCPACALEETGKDPAASMKALVNSVTHTKESPGQAAERSSSAISGRDEAWPGETRISASDQIVLWARNLLLRARERPAAAAVVVAGAALLAFTVVRLTGPRFIEQPDPPPVPGEVLPLPLEPGQPVTVLFALLGAETPQSDPQAGKVERYRYRTGVTVDALNGVVRSILIDGPGRSWKGVWVGLTERQAEGAVALLGRVTPGGALTPPSPEIQGRYQVYPSPGDRPERTLATEVRPPNGCYDVSVALRPRAIGVLEDGDLRYSVVGRRGETPVWVVTRVQVLSRAAEGMEADSTGC